MRISMMSKMLLAALASASMMSPVHAAAATKADGDQGPPRVLHPRGTHFTTERSATDPSQSSRQGHR